MAVEYPYPDKTQIFNNVTKLVKYDVKRIKKTLQTKRKDWNYFR